MIKALDIWLPAWLRRGRAATTGGVRHVMLAVCDHFEPRHGADGAEAKARVEHWQREFPKMAGEFRDADGCAPKHTFFFPIEQYESEIVGRIADLCHATGCETEVHLHHDRDTADNLRRTLAEGVARLRGHGLLSTDESDATRYGFVHGNWALDNSHPEGRHCGVRNELATLRETGCYADFTLPSAPNRTQTRTINSLYYARGTDRPKSHDTGRRVRVGQAPSPGDQNELLIVQGPLALNWRWRKFGVLPRIENSDLTGTNPPTAGRLRLWLECQVTVAGKPDWLFVKLHTHGAKPDNSRMLLGEPMRAFHRSLAALAVADHNLRFHYVSARELVNIVHAAEAGCAGDPGEYRNFRYRQIQAGQPVTNVAESRR